MINFRYQRPASLEEACQLLQQPGEHKLLAGGTDLIIQLKEERILLDSVVSLASVPELRGVELTPEGALHIGAATTISDLTASPLLAQFQPALAAALATIGSPQVRNRATLGGNLCNASPAADSAPLLLALNAEVELVGCQGKRHLPLEQLFLGNGRIALQKGELLAAIILPAEAARSKALYLKQGIRQSMDIAIASVAVALLLEDGKCKQAGIGLGSVASRPIRAHHAEHLLLSTAVADFNAVALAARSESAAIDDVRASAGYRQDVVEALTRRILETLYSV